jgi:uncharacterized membrane protein YhhN
MLYVALVLFFSFWGLFINSIVKKKRMKGFYLKGFTSLTFMLVFAIGVYDFYVKNNGLTLSLIDNKYLIFTLFIGLGLVCGLLGDLFLEVQYFYDKEKDSQIFSGMIAFFIGHIFYIVALSALIGFNYLSMIIGLVFTLVVAVGGIVLKMNFGKLKLPSYLYTFIIFTMVGQSMFLAIDNQFNLFSIVLMLGAILFGISDLLLAPIYFKGDKRVSFAIANLATYYLAQLFIALSILFLI